MKSWNQFTHFAALDSAKDHHDVVVVDRQGTVVADFRIAHDCAGWRSLAEKLRGFDAVAIAIETLEGPAVEQIEAVRSAIKASAGSLHEVISSLKQAQREQRGTEKEIQSVRSILQNLQRVRI